MREILFRGKRVDNGEWVEGCLLKVTLNGKTAHLIFGDNFTFVGNDVKALSHALVDPETVGQYTGMTDKNGTKIFEGDIVRDNGGTVYPVIWGGTGFYLKYDPLHAHGFHYDLLPLCNYWHAQGAIIEVVGNIHDNPELLNGGSNNA